jgi:DNA replication and repair protein RecF
MKILNARLCNFRNHDDTEFEFGSHANVLFGENGMGKTNALEALSFLCLTKSFYASADATVVKRGAEHFSVDGMMESDEGKEFAVRVAYDDRQRAKRFTINGADVERLSSVLGMFPVVVLSPENSAVTFGSPADRRRFVDIVISQSSPVYVEDMLEYRRIVRQRNKMLADAQGRELGSDLAPWTEMLVRYGARIIERRNAFLADFAPYIERTYREIAGGKEQPKIEYAPTVSVDSGATEASIRTALERKLERRKADERRFQTTLAGPHRDEVIFSLNGMSLKHFASQGQHKTFLVALKVAEFHYLQERCSETPVFLLDDVFSELDEQRSRNLLDVVASMGQTFITTTGAHLFGGSYWSEHRRQFLIRNGAVAKVEQA